MKCPLDGTDLAMAERQGVEIDYCPKCRGVWLDRGELDKIVEKSAAEAAPPAAPYQPAPQPQYQQHQGDYRGGHQPKRRKKKSFFEDIFDF